MGFFDTLINNLNGWLVCGLEFLGISSCGPQRIHANAHQGIPTNFQFSKILGGMILQPSKLRVCPHMLMGFNCPLKRHYSCILGRNFGGEKSTRIFRVSKTSGFERERCPKATSGGYQRCRASFLGTAEPQTDSVPQTVNTGPQPVANRILIGLAWEVCTFQICIQPDDDDDDDCDDVDNENEDEDEDNDDLDHDHDDDDDDDDDLVCYWVGSWRMGKCQWVLRGDQLQFCPSTSLLSGILKDHPVGYTNYTARLLRLPRAQYSFKGAQEAWNPKPIPKF